MPSALDLLLSQLRRDLERSEAPMRSQLILAYESAIYDLEHDLYYVTWLIEDAMSRGEEITPDWLYRQDRYKRLIAKAEEQLSRFSDTALPIIQDTTRNGITLGANHASPLLEAAGIRASFGTTTNTHAVDALYQLMFREGPVRDVLDSYAGNATAVIRHHMGQGVIQGLSPREVVRNITRDLASGTNRARLSTLVRTEHMRAYRMSQGQQLERFSHAIKAWRWSSAHQVRTCLACLAMDGELFDEPQYKMHPNCRCICVPVGYFTPERYQRQSGAEWFASQPVATQREMMPSQAAFDAYKRGEISLSDFVGEKHSEVWGTSLFQRSGKEAIRNADLRSESWIDSDGAWSPPPPAKNSWRKGMPEEGDARAEFGPEWMDANSTARVPKDLAEDIGSSQSMFGVDDHALNQVVPGAKHENAKPYLENIDAVLEHASFVGMPNKSFGTDRRIEVYTMLPDGGAVLTIIGQDGDKPPRVITLYVVGESTVGNRRRRLRKRE